MAAETQLAPDTVIVSREAHGSPFAGLTLAQARVLNVALAWCPVEVYGGRHQVGPEVFVFERVVLPGMGLHSPFEMVGDLCLTHTRPDRVLPQFGLGRVLSASLVRRFDVLAIEPQFRSCSQCSCVMPLTEKVFDLGGLGLTARVFETVWNGEPEWEQRFECRACFEAC